MIPPVGLYTEDMIRTEKSTGWSQVIKTCRNCKKIFTAEDIKKQLLCEHLSQSAFNKRTFCSSECAYAFRVKPAKNYFHFIENPFPSEVKIDWHHVNDLIVFPLPSLLHDFSKDNHFLHRVKCNGVIENLFSLNVMELLNER